MSNRYMGNFKVHNGKIYKDFVVLDYLKDRYPDSFIIAVIGGGTRRKDFEKELLNGNFETTPQVVELAHNHWMDKETDPIDMYYDEFLRIMFADSADMIKFKLEYL